MKLVTKEVAERDKNVYPQNWPAYNAAQVEEKLQFLGILSELCSYIPDYPNGGPGRPRMRLGR